MFEKLLKWQRRCNSPRKLHTVSGTRRRVLIGCFIPYPYFWPELIEIISLCSLRDFAPPMRNNVDRVRNFVTLSQEIACAHPTEELRYPVLGNTY